MPEGMNETFIDPGVKTHYSYIAPVSEKATTLLMHTWFNYADENAQHSAEKTVSVPSAHLGTAEQAHAADAQTAARG
jgi:hypothetical protein